MSELSRSADPRRVKSTKKITNNPSVLKKVLKYGSFALLAVVICVATFVGFIWMKADRLIDKIGDNTPPPFSSELTDPSTPDGQVPQKNATEPITFLVLGTDYRDATSSLNTDVIMVVSLNPDTKSATLVSLPRDLIMRPKGLPEKKANYYYAHFYSQDKDTANQKVKQVFSEFLKVPIDYLVTINFHGFEQVIDELGGLTIDVDQNMRYIDTFDGTNINLKKGVQKLNGKQTLDFIRYRKSNNGETPESNDLQRNERQQQVIDKMLDKLMSLGGIIKLGQLIDVLGNNLKTDIPSAQIRDMIRKYFGIESSNITYIQPDGTWVSPYIYLNNNDLQNARRALRKQLGMDTSDDKNIFEPAIAPPPPQQVQSQKPPNNGENGNSNSNNGNENGNGNGSGTNSTKPVNETPPGQNNNSQTTPQKPDQSTPQTPPENNARPNQGEGTDPDVKESEPEQSENNNENQPDQSVQSENDDQAVEPPAQNEPETDEENPLPSVEQPDESTSPAVTDPTDTYPSSEPQTENNDNAILPGIILDNPLGIPENNNSGNTNLDAA